MVNQVRKGEVQLDICNETVPKIDEWFHTFGEHLNLLRTLRMQMWSFTYQRLSQGMSDIIPL